MSVLTDVLRHQQARAALRRLGPDAPLAEHNRYRAVLGLPLLVECPDEVES